MKILILHQHFKTPMGGGAIRSYYLAKALTNAGHRVVVITSSNDNQHKKSTFEGIEIHFLPIPYDNRMKFYGRGRAFVRYVIMASGAARPYRDFDICYAISVPLTVGIIARWLKFRFGLPYIFEVGDLWPDAPIQMGFVKNTLFQRALLALEKSIYKGANTIVALSPAIKAVIETKIRGKTIRTIPNMADCEFFTPEEKSQFLVKKFGVQDKFVVSYIGALGIANGLDYFLECARASGDANLPVQFILCGDGAVRDTLETDIKRHNLKNVLLMNFVNRDGVKEIMNVTDAVFICYKHLPILETGSPNKYFDGLAAGKLIVINFSGWIKKEVEETGCGIFIDPQQPDDFVKNLDPFLRDHALLSKYQRASRQLAEAKYSREKLSMEFQSLFPGP